jgi:ElaA protein
MPAIVIQEVTSPGEIERAIAIRRTVFVDEQGVSEAQEIDGLDGQARHLLASVEGEPAGTLRIRLLDDGRLAKIERVAVLAPQRQHRIGHRLMAAALEHAQAEGAVEALVHAQTIVQAFYVKLGFAPVRPAFVEDGIDHIAMSRALTRPPAGGR